MKRTVYTDGWHTRGDFDFLVENGRLIRGVRYSEGGAVTVYPFCPVKSGGMDNVNGIIARYGILKKIYWY